MEFNVGDIGRTNLNVVALLGARTIRSTSALQSVLDLLRPACRQRYKTHKNHMLFR